MVSLLAGADGTYSHRFRGGIVHCPFEKQRISVVARAYLLQIEDTSKMESHESA